MLERVIHYLVGTMDYDIHYSENPAVLEGYNDVNWISDVDELYAMSGYVFTLGGAAISWRSWKQIILMRSIMETELAAPNTTNVEADRFRELLMDLPIVDKTLSAILMNCDNQTVIVKTDSSKDNMKSSRHQKTVKVCLKNEKLRGYYIGLYSY
jgi:hypothetical protein